MLVVILGSNECMSWLPVVLLDMGGGEECKEDVIVDVEGVFVVLRAEEEDGANTVVSTVLVQYACNVCLDRLLASSCALKPRVVLVVEEVEIDLLDDFFFFFLTPLLLEDFTVSGAGLVLGAPL